MTIGRFGPRVRGLGRAAVVASAIAATAPLAVAAPFEDTMAQRVLACTGCHGAQGRAGPDGYYPRIAGKPAGYLYNQLLAFRDGRRHYALMARLLAPLDDAYLRQIAAHFASLEVAYPAPSPAVDAQAGRDAVAERLVRRGDPGRRLPACADCHGEALLGTAPSVPGLLGLPRDYLNAQLGAWRTGKRAAPAPDCMATVAEALREDEIVALTGWLASRPVPAGAKPAPSFPAALPLACGGVSP